MLASFTHAFGRRINVKPIGDLAPVQKGGELTIGLGDVTQDLVVLALANPYDVALAGLPLAHAGIEPRLDRLAAAFEVLAVANERTTAI